MLRTKVLEIRDKATFIPVLATEVSGGASVDDQENWLLRRAGFGERMIQLTSFNRNESHHDPYEWGDRTYQTAHLYIHDNWNFIEDGQVIDVEYILGETDIPKKTEREEYE